MRACRAERLRASKTVAKDLDSPFGLIAEGAKREKLSQPGRVKFFPCDTLQVPRDNTQQLPACAQLLQKFANRRTEFATHTVAIALDFCTHDRQRPRQLARKILRFDLVLLGHGAQNADIGVAVYGNGIEQRLDAKHLAQSLAEGVPVNAIVGVQQGAINIKQVGIGGKGIKARFDEQIAGLRCRLHCTI